MHGRSSLSARAIATLAAIALTLTACTRLPAGNTPANKAVSVTPTAVGTIAATPAPSLKIPKRCNDSLRLDIDDHGKLLNVNATREVELTASEGGVCLVTFNGLDPQKASHTLTFTPVAGTAGNTVEATIPYIGGDQYQVVSLTAGQWTVHFDRSDKPAFTLTVK